MHRRPSCPQCGKAFDSEVQVQRHLNQPRTKCHQRPIAFADTTGLIEQFAAQPWTHHLPGREELRDFQRRPRHDASQSGHSRHGSVDSETLDTSISDYFPGAAKVVDQSSTKFMDTFDQDRFAEIRDTQNIYYPFADRPEWELAEFLATSELSMAAIDRFLSLPLVSYFSKKMTEDLINNNI